jgi:hypothetical protein
VDRGKEDTPPSEPCHVEDSAVEGNDGEFDGTDSPCVDESDGKIELV